MTFVAVGKLHQHSLLTSCSYLQAHLFLSLFTIVPGNRKAISELDWRLHRQLGPRQQAERNPDPENESASGRFRKAPIARRCGRIGNGEFFFIALLMSICGAWKVMSCRRVLEGAAEGVGMADKQRFLRRSVQFFLYLCFWKSRPVCIKNLLSPQDSSENNEASVLDSACLWCVCTRSEVWTWTNFSSLSLQRSTAGNTECTT